MEPILLLFFFHYAYSFSNRRPYTFNQVRMQLRGCCRMHVEVCELHEDR